MTYDEVAMLEGIRRSGTIHDLPFLLPRITGSGDVRLEAIHALDGILARLTSRDVLRLEASRQRLLGLGDTHCAWSKVTPAVVPTLPHAVQKLALFHSSGYVRGAAVRELSHADGEDLVSYFLVRANDWVGAVSQLAQTALRARATAPHMSAWVRALPIMARLERESRWELRPYLEMGYAVLAMPEARAVLVDAVRSGSREVKRASFDRLARQPREDVADVFKELETARDQVLAARAALYALATTDFAERRAAAERLLASASVGMRVRALDALLSLPDAPMEIARRALFDTNASVRIIAQFALQKRAPLDLARMYREAIDARGAHTLVAIDALADVGAREDVARVLPFVRDPSPRMRAAALRTLAHLEGDRQHALFTAALQDPSGRVRRAARMARRTRARL